jgi:NusA-like KH domain protein
MEVEFPRPTEDLGRIAAQTAKEVIFKKVGANQSVKRALPTELIVASTLSTIAVALGFGNWPYGYYQLLRLLLCLVSLFFISRSDLRLPDWSRWVLGGFALLYNPIVPIQIGDKVVWEALNVLTIIFFWTALLRWRPLHVEDSYAEYSHRVGEVVNGMVKRVENGDIIVELGRVEAQLPRKEQSRAENYTVSDRVRAVIRGVNRSANGPQIVLSRTDPALLIKLFEQEIPEVYDGSVMIRGAVREAGDRAKVAVYSHDRDVDPVGACVGMKGTRVQSIIRELRGEKIDIVEWSEDPILFVTNAISPAKVQRVSIVDDRERVMEVIVQEEQLSLAIGKKGQNVRLAAKLTGWKIDIKSEEEKRREVETQLGALEIGESAVPENAETEPGRRT